MTIRRLTFRLTELDDPFKYGVKLIEDGAITAEADFSCSPRTERKTSQALDDIDTGRCKYDDLCYVGSQLWDGLVAGNVQARYKVIRDATRQEKCLFHIRLCLPRAWNRCRGSRCTTPRRPSSRRRSASALFETSQKTSINPGRGLGPAGRSKCSW